MWLLWLFIRIVSSSIQRYIWSNDVVDIMWILCIVDVFTNKYNSKTRLCVCCMTRAWRGGNETTAVLTGTMDQCQVCRCGGGGRPPLTTTPQSRPAKTHSFVKVYLVFLLNMIHLSGWRCSATTSAVWSAFLPPPLPRPLELANTRNFHNNREGLY